MTSSDEDPRVLWAPYCHLLSPRPSGSLEDSWPDWLGWGGAPRGHHRARGAPVQRLPGTHSLPLAWGALTLRDCEPCWTAALARPGGPLSRRDLLAHMSSFGRTCTEERVKLSLPRSVSVPDSSFQQPPGQARGSADWAQTRLSHMLTLEEHLDSDPSLALAAWWSPSWAPELRLHSRHRPLPLVRFSEEISEGNRIQFYCFLHCMLWTPCLERRYKGLRLRDV